MTVPNAPRPGEIWRYTSPLIGDRVGVVGADGRATMIDGDNRIPVDARAVGDGPVAYSAGVVDQLRADLAESRKLAEAISDDREREFEAKIKAYADRHPTLGELVRDEPWRVLRAAAEVFCSADDGWYAHGLDCEVLADELEREHAENTLRKQLIEALESATSEAAEKFATALMAAGIIDSEGRDALIGFDFSEAIAAMAETMLAEAVDQ